MRFGKWDKDAVESVMVGVFLSLCFLFGVWVLFRGEIAKAYYSFKNRGQPACSIKGNISIGTGAKIYHMTNQKYYSKTVIDTSSGEKMFCSEQEAKEAGWRKSNE